MGDSIAAGEGNPDRAIALGDDGFCFRRFLAGSTSEYFRPGRAGFKGNKACDPALSAGSGNTSADWAKLNARWWSASCHRSLYGYQVRAALAIAVENPHVAVTFLPLACSGSTIDAGVFGSLRARECPATGSCTNSNVAQMVRLKEAIDLARKTDKERKLDAILLTVGANDIWFSGLVADVITESATERALFKRGGLIADVSEARDYLSKFPRDFAKLRDALKPYLDGNLQRVVYVTYGNPAMVNGGQVCAGGRAGFDVHPAFNVDSAKLREASDFVEREFLPRLRALATCEASGTCRDPRTDRMTFVDQHQAEFAQRGFCARSPRDPVFDRECFLDNGESFESNPSQAATDPLRCRLRARDFRPYSSRARWIRTANDSYFTAMTFPEGISTAVQPSDLHDATWGATSAVYGGAVHPTAEGHAAMADAAIPALRAVLGLQAPQQVHAEPLAPLSLPPAATR
jgi:lysophospholipase L1-like esterase